MIQATSVSGTMYKCPDYQALPCYTSDVIANPTVISTVELLLKDSLVKETSQKFWCNSIHFYLLRGKTLYYKQNFRPQSVRY